MSLREAAYALALLSERQQTIVYLRVKRQLSTQAIAEALNLTPSEVETLEEQARTIINDAIKANRRH